MKRNLIKALALAALTGAAGIASAAGNTSLTVTATVASVCKFSNATQNVTIALDPSAGAAATGSWSVPYKCTKDKTTGSVAVTSGGTTLTAGGGATIAYSVTAGTFPTTGAGFGQAATNLTVDYSVAQTAYEDKPAGSYTDTVVLTITD